MPATTPVPALVSALAFAIAASAGEVRFTDVAADAGLDFRHDNGMTGKVWLVEIMGAGVGIFDFDDDGWQDIWVVQGGPLADRGGALPCDRLYRNIGNGALRFRDITGESGVCADGYGMGIATGDIDNDGDIDVFIANYGANQLFENLGEGRFRDITANAGITGDDWSVSATFADIDGDGRLDLYVANYAAFDLADHKPCTDAESRPSYCSPEVYQPTQDRLYRNLGRGEFQDISGIAGIDKARSAALGVVAEDFDGDGDIDFYVANDMSDNLLWLNQGNGKFTDNALFAGVAVNGDGVVEASMGVVAADFDRDCDVDLFMTHLAAQTNTLYANDGNGWFTDRSSTAGVAAASVPYTGFGTAWFDAENDGDLDLFSANGAVTAIQGQSPGPLGLPLRQPNQLWLNDGRGRYRERTNIADFAVEEVSRGTASGDLDNDGDLDLVVTNNRGPARLYRNDSVRAHWLGVELHAPAPHLAVGSRVRLHASCPGLRIATDGSYASAHDPRVVFGLGAQTAPAQVRITWATGEEEVFGPLAVDRYHRLHTGAGRVLRR